MDSGREQNYWPGFVDALSNVVLTLVFVLVIFVFALVIASNKVEQQIQQVTQEAAKKSGEGSQEKAELRQQLATAQAEIDKLRGQAGPSDQRKSGSVNQQAVAAQNQDKQIAVQNPTVNPMNQGPVNIVHAQDSVVLSFPIAVAQMDQKSEDQLGHVLDALEKTAGKHKIIVHSIIGRETYSVARRMAYYRAINARNYLVGKTGETPSNITISLVTPAQPEDGRVEIIFQKK